MPRSKLSLSFILERIQQLQTVSVEVSCQLRNQTVQEIQTQVIRLEDIGETELEDSHDTDVSMNELMQCVLFTELRKDIRGIATALDDLQYRLFASHQNTAEASENHSEAEQNAGAASSSNNGSANDNGMDDRIIVSGEDNGACLNSPGTNNDTTFGEVFEATAQIEKHLYDACMEIHEWRRTDCIVEFINAMKRKYPSLTATRSINGDHAQGDESVDGTKSPSESSMRVPVDQIIRDARERRRLAEPGQSLSPLPSRLVQVENEAEAMRYMSPGNYTRSPKCQQQQQQQHQQISPSLSAPADRSSAVLPFGNPYNQTFNSLRLIEDTDQSEATRNYANDVRIVGWETVGKGLDIHTEFKVIAHLTRGGDVTVLRRYTDFVILREVLCRRYHAFRKRMPKLPPKQAFGKFDDGFLKRREKGLQFFIAYAVLHPVIGASSVIRQWFEGRHQ